MSFQQWAGAKALVIAFKVIRDGGKVNEMITSLDGSMDDAFGDKYSEEIQKEFIEKMLFPIAKGLMGENPAAYREMLEKEIINVRS